MFTALTNVGELGNAAARRVTFARNRPAELSCSLSHHDPEAQLLLDALANGIPQVIAYRHDAATNHGGKTKRFRFPLARSSPPAGRQRLPVG